MPHKELEALAAMVAAARRVRIRAPRTFDELDPIERRALASEGLTAASEAGRDE